MDDKKLSKFLNLMRSVLVAGLDMIDFIEEMDDVDDAILEDEIINEKIDEILGAEMD